MEPRLLVALALLVVAALVAWVVERRRSASPFGAGAAVPERLDRGEFTGPEKPWLVVLFSSRTCDSCRDLAPKVHALASGDVAVQEVEYGTDRRLHQRYRIDTVPLTVVADAGGAVRTSFLGPVTATDLWAGVAEVRQPGSVDDPDAGGRGPVDDPDAGGRGR